MKTARPTIIFSLFFLVSFFVVESTTATGNCSCSLTLSGFPELVDVQEDRCYYEYNIYGIEEAEDGARELAACSAAAAGLEELIYVDSGTEINQDSFLSEMQLIYDSDSGCAPGAEAEVMSGQPEDGMLGLPFTLPSDALDCSVLNNKSGFFNESGNLGYKIEFFNGRRLSTINDYFLDTSFCKTGDPNLVIPSNLGGSINLQNEYNNFHNSSYARSLFGSTVRYSGGQLNDSEGNLLKDCAPLPKTLVAMSRAGMLNLSFSLHDTPPIESAPDFQIDEENPCPSNMRALMDVGEGNDFFYFIELACDFHPRTEAPTETGIDIPFFLPDASGLNKFSSSTNLQEIIGRLAGFFVGIVGALGLMMFVYAGFLWMTSAGSAEKVKKALTIIIWTALGMITMLSVYAILKFVFEAFGV
jgi:hypothetical protein